jgi:hypothetical protein
MNMAKTFRLYGPEIGINTAVVDADVTGVTTNGDIVLTPQDTNYSEFSLSSERIRELVNSGLAYDKNEIDTKDEVWGAIDDVETRYEKDDDNLEPYTDAARRLFQGGP